MPTLESFQGRSLVPDIIGQLGRGVQLGGQIQQQRLLQQQAQAQQQQQAQLQQLLGQLGGGQPLGAPTAQPQLGAQIPTTPGFAPPSVSGQAQPALTRTQAQQQLAIQFPQVASDISAAQKAQFEASQAPVKARIGSVVQFAAELKGLGAPQQIRKLEERRVRLQQQGLPTNDTDEHLALLKSGRIEEANALTDQAVQLGERIGVLKPIEKAEVLTTTQKDYNLAKKEGFEGSFIDYRQAVSGVGPKTQLEMAMLQTQIEDIKDRRLAREEKRESVKQIEVKKVRGLVGQIDSVLDEVGKAKTGVKGIAATGIAGAVTASIVGSPSYNLRRRVETIKANLGFDKLQSMRDASPTGGALGQVSERELTLLTAALTTLDPNMGEDLMLEALDKIETHYNNWRSTITGESSVATITPAGQPPAQVGRFTVESE